ncbi:MFS transporter [bacterium]|nr:MFS transporter [bacterium]
MTDAIAAENRSRRSVIVVGLMMAMFLSAIEATIVATAMPTIVGDLGGLKLYGLVGSSYLLAATVTIPIYGRLADLRGRKTMMLLGIGLFLLGSALCALAPRLGFLVIGRVVQGLGAGAIQPITMTLVGDLFALEERGRIQGLMGTLWGFAGIAGPLLGGTLVSTLGWRSIFWLNIPFGLMAAGVLWKYLREPAHTNKFRQLDWAGGALLVTGSGALLAASGGTYALPLAAAGTALLVALFFVERHASQPLLPLELLTRRDVAVGSLSALTIGVCFMGILNFLPLFIQSGLGRSASVAGSSLTPLLIGWPIAATAASTLMVRTGFRTPLLIGSFAVAIAAAALRFWMQHPVQWMLWPVMILMGAGFGLATSSVVIAVQTSVGYAQRGLATAFNMFSRSMGGAVGVGMAGVLVGVSVGGHGGATDVGADAESLVAALETVFLVFAGLALLHIPLCWFYPKSHTAHEDGASAPPIEAHIAME